MQKTLIVNGIECITVLVDRLWHVVIDNQSKMLYRGKVKDKSKRNGFRSVFKLKSLCQLCGKEFFGLLSDLRKYCSYSCSNKISVKLVHNKFISISNDEELKRKARHFIEYLIKTRRIICPKVCSNCDCHGNIQAHHPRYDKPNEVKWWCKPCHQKFHFGHKIEGKLIVYAL